MIVGALCIVCAIVFVVYLFQEVNFIICSLLLIEKFLTLFTFFLNISFNISMLLFSELAISGQVVKLLIFVLLIYAPCQLHFTADAEFKSSSKIRALVPIFHPAVRWGGGGGLRLPSQKFGVEL